MKREPMYRYLLSLILILAGIVSFVFVSADNQASSPEAAAVEYAREMKNAGFKIYAETIEAVQKLELESSTLVLVQYSGFRLGGGAEICDMVMETNRVLLFRWKATGGSGGCTLINDLNDPLPITASGGWTSPEDQASGYSLVHGRVRDLQIAKVTVTWNDGQEQSAVVKNATYLVVREGRSEMKSVVAFNGQNEIIYTSRD